MKVVSVVGARPQFIKCAPCFVSCGWVAQQVLVHIGQHTSAIRPGFEYPLLEFRLMSHKDRSQFLHPVPHPIEGLTLGQARHPGPYLPNRLWRLH